MKISRSFWLGILLLMVVASGCTGSSLAKRDLSTVVLQANELPKEYSDVAKKDPKDGLFNDSALLNSDLVNSVEMDLDYPKEVSPTRGFSSVIFVYKNSSAAHQAYETLKGDLTDGVDLAFARLGDEMISIKRSVPIGDMDVWAGMVIWRHKEAVSVLFEMNDQEIDAARLEKLAKAIETRLSQ